LIFCGGCGVKGDPLPPHNEPYIGRGGPTYQKATKDLDISPEKQQQDEEKGKESQ